MRRTTRIPLMALALAAGSIPAASNASPPTFILDGYKFSQPIPGVSTADLEGKLRHKPGARVTEADIDVDAAILAKELGARHIGGEIATGLAEKHGHVLVVFGYRNVPEPPTRHLESQNFQGESRISASALIAASGLKNGMVLVPKNINAARGRILALYAKTMPHKSIDLKCKVQIRRSNGNVMLTWMISEPK